MMVDWLIVIGAMIVLWVPSSWLYPSRGREMLSEQRGTRFRLNHFFLTWQHWVDGVRGFLGTYFLLSMGLTNATGERSDFYTVFVLHAVILAIAIGLQTVQFRKVVYCTAPVMFLIGMTFALSDWQAALFAAVFSLVVFSVGNLELKFVIFGGLLGISGYFIVGPDLYLILNCGLAVLPLVLTYISNCTFVIYTRALAD